VKNIFTEADKNEILKRVEKLTPQSQPLWGTMTVSQMLAHFAEACKIPIGEVKPRRASFPLNIFGMLIKSAVLGPKPFRHNTPTAPETRITADKDFEKEKVNFINAVNKLYNGGEKSVTATHHHVLGKFTPNQWGRMAYKHADHHLSQFAV
jgi:Protein of unknown function (DUF1569)